MLDPVLSVSVHVKLAESVRISTFAETLVVVEFVSVNVWVFKVESVWRYEFVVRLHPLQLGPVSRVAFWTVLPVAWGTMTYLQLSPDVGLVHVEAPEVSTLIGFVAVVVFTIGSLARMAEKSLGVQPH